MRIVKMFAFLLAFMIYEACFHTKKPLSLEHIGRCNSKFSSELPWRQVSRAGKSLATV